MYIMNELQINAAIQTWTGITLLAPDAFSPSTTSTVLYNKHKVPPCTGILLLHTNVYMLDYLTFPKVKWTDYKIYKTKKAV